VLTGYLRKDAEPETLLAAVRAVAAGRTYIDLSLGRQLLTTTAADDLTPRGRSSADWFHSTVSNDRSG
jgi:DNA-binding NarL/FixJ family response regulator